jgi:OmpA-OmpF porin, OOP family
MPPAPRRAWLPALAALAFATTLAPRAGAQTQTFAVDRLVMAGAPGDGIAVWRPDMADKTRFFGQLGLGLSVNPLRTSNIADNLDVQKSLEGNPLTRQVITYFNVGAEILGRVSLQVAFPLIVDQAGNPTSSSAMTTPTPVSLATVAPGDMRIEARGVIFRTDERDFKLALNAAAYVPTGNKLSFAGDGSPGASFGLAAEYDARLFSIVLNAAYRLRPTVVFNELPVSSEFQYGLGMYAPLRRGTIRLGAEFFGAVGANPTKLAVLNSAPPGAPTKSNVGDLDATPLEWMLNGRMYFTTKRQVYVGLGAGTRLTGGFAPDFRAVAVVGGSFSVTDSDPKSPGGRYVFETSDPKDTDGDGIPDEVDACPNEPGEMDPDPEKIGCPKYIRRVKGSNEIEVLKRIEFEFDRSTVLPVSYPILDEVVALLQANPTIKKVVIEGHTDNQGTAEYNQKLSDDRANSVMAYIAGKGIAASRMEAKGYGLTKPRATNDTDEGRQRNRRVEFHITEQSAPTPVVK